MYRYSFKDLKKEYSLGCHTTSVISICISNQSLQKNVCVIQAIITSAETVDHYYPIGIVNWFSKIFELIEKRCIHSIFYDFMKIFYEFVIDYQGILQIPLAKKIKWSIFRGMLGRKLIWMNHPVLHVLRHIYVSEVVCKGTLNCV